MLAWQQIDTVLLDMDGTLLDLHFDNHFWLDFMPRRYAELNNLSAEQGKAELQSRYEKVQGTLAWYCLDFWGKELNLDIVALKREIQHLISLREDTLPFLKSLQAANKHVILVTNAHPDSLSLKMERTQIDGYIDTLISTHELGYSKESQRCWQRLQERVNFDSERTLFVDDSLGILAAAKEFGIKHVVAVANPDSKQASREISEFPAVTDLRDMLPD